MFSYLILTTTLKGECCNYPYSIGKERISEKLSYIVQSHGTGIGSELGSWALN